MDTTRNPIHGIAKRVIHGELTLEEARAQVASTLWRPHICPEHVLHLFVWIPVHAQEDRAEVYWCLALSAAQWLGIPPQILANMSADLGKIRLVSGKFACAVEALSQARDLLKTHGGARDLAYTDLMLGEAWLGLEEPEEALLWFDSVWEYLQDTGPRQDLGRCEFNMGRCFLGLGQPQQARKFLKLARASFKRAQSATDLARCDCFESRLNLDAGRPVRALKLAQTALEALDHGQATELANHCHALMEEASSMLEQREQAAGK